MKQTPQVGIIMGSDSDLPIMQKAALVLEEYAISFEITIVSAHRTPRRMFEYAASAKKRGVQIIIAGAGGAAHLPGMVAALTELPVIGVPIQTKALQGVDSLYSIVQMPQGVPVATVAINGAYNAGLLAIKILALQEKTLQTKITKWMQSQNDLVVQKGERLLNTGYKKYLKVISGQTK